MSSFPEEENNLNQPGRASYQWQLSDSGENGNFSCKRINICGYEPFLSLQKKYNKMKSETQIEPVGVLTKGFSPPLAQTERNLRTHQ